MTTRDKVAAAPGVATSTRPRGRGIGLRLSPYLFLLPSAILLLAFFTAPMISLLYYGFRETALDGTSHFTGLDNYGILAQETRFRANFTATAQYLVGNLLIATPIAYFAAVLISSKVRGSGSLRTLFLIPWVLSSVVTALLFKTMLDPNSGPVTQLLEFIVGRPLQLTLSQEGSVLVIIMHAAWRSFPIQMLLIAAGMASIPQELYESVRVDGGNKWDEFRYITFPLTRVALMAAILIITVFTLQDAEGVYALTQGGPGYATETAAVRLFKEAFVYFNIGLASSIGLALIVVTVIILFLYSRVPGQKEAN